MKNIFVALLLSLTLNSCAVDNFNTFKSLSTEEREKIMLTRDVRTNLFPEDKNFVYVASFGKRWDKGKGVRNTDGRKCDIFLKCIPAAIEIALNKCKKEFDLNKAKKIDYRVIPEKITNQHKLYSQVYWVYECSQETPKKKSITQNAVTSINSTNRNFTCDYVDNISEKSKIVIRGPEATEETAIGIIINYSIVEISDKGAFTLKGASNDPGRAWFIGAQSFLLLDAKVLPYNCY